MRSTGDDGGEGFPLPAYQNQPHTGQILLLAPEVFIDFLFGESTLFYEELFHDVLFQNMSIDRIFPGNHCGMSCFNMCYFVMFLAAEINSESTEFQYRLQDSLI